MYLSELISSLFQLRSYRVYNYTCDNHFSIHMVIVLNCKSPPGCLKFMMYFVGGFGEQTSLKFGGQYPEHP